MRAMRRDRGIAPEDLTMASKDEWLADMRRWYFDERTSTSGTPAEAVASEFAPSPDTELGYEAAQPALQMQLLREWRQLRTEG